MKFKVGDKVKIKSLDWYNENQDSLGDVDCGCEIFLKEMAQYCGKIMTIFKTFDDDTYVMVEDVEDEYFWCDEMIEGLADESQEKMVSLDKVKGWIKENMYECDSGDEKWVNTYFHTFEEMFNDFDNAMEK